jgi:hypothetical protein
VTGPRFVVDLYGSGPEWCVWDHRRCRNAHDTTPDVALWYTRWGTAKLVADALNDGRAATDVRMAEF